MAFPYSSGDVLTAADLNASSGLVFISSTTVGSGVSSVTVSSAFSSTFENYKVVITGIATSSSATLQLVLGGATGHYGALTYLNHGGTGSNIRVSNGANLPINYLMNSNADNGNEMTITRPFSASYTQVFGTAYGAGNSVWFGGSYFVATSLTGFTISPSAGTMTGGTIRVYGYNNG